MGQKDPIYRVILPSLHKLYATPLCIIATVFSGIVFVTCGICVIVAGGVVKGTVDAINSSL